MEMKQKEQEINKRKKRLLWKEKRMKETVLNAMNPVEREIFEKELQKVHLKKSTALNDIGKTVWDTKKIRELLDQDAELEEIKRFFDENQLKPDQYNRNAIPLAAYTGMEEAAAGKMSACGHSNLPQRLTDFFRYRSRPIWRKLQRNLSAWINTVSLRSERCIFMKNCAGPMRPIIWRL